MDSIATNVDKSNFAQKYFQTVAKTQLNNVNKCRYNQTMTIDDAIKRAGSSSELARLLGVSRGAVYLWKTRKFPKLRLFQLKALRPGWFK